MGGALETVGPEFPQADTAASGGRLDSITAANCLDQFGLVISADS